jgi:outer membrane protein OmpA-like peptidoglycan-associated protein
MMKIQIRMQRLSKSAIANTRRSIMTKTMMAIAIVLTVLTVTSSVQAQSVAGRIAFGFDFGGNKYYGNYTDNQFGFPAGDAFIRWNILDWLSLHASYNGGQLKYKATTAGSILDEQTLFKNVNASPGTDGTVNHTRYGGWDLMASFNVFPDQTFVPYFIVGLEALNFEPNDANDKNLRGNASAAYSKNVIGGVLGVGYEMYVSPKVVFNGKVLLHLTGTDWLDDYSNRTSFRQDAFLTMGVGFSYYIFAPDIVPKPEGGYRSESNTTNITNNYTTNIVKGDTIVVFQTDTVYKDRPRKNTIYNFPGTLFIVNTDEFNMNVAGNMQNLRNIKSLVNQCPGLQVEIQGHASHEGTVARNQELSEMRARKIKAWLIGEGVDPNRIVSTVGLGTSDDAVHEPANASPTDLETARVQNRRIAVKVVVGCEQ